MQRSLETTESLDVLAKVLLRCALFGYLFVTLWFCLYLFAGNTIYRWHGEMFTISKHELDLIFYCGMGMTKVLVFLFFLSPWLAIRWVLRKA